MFIRFYVISLHAPRGTREKMEIVTKARIDIRQEELQLRGVGFRCCETDNAVVENCVILEKSCCHSTADKTAANEHMGPLIQASIRNGWIAPAGISGRSDILPTGLRPPPSV